MENLQSKLSWVQTNLNVPKAQLNNFGGYKYRSCEDILEALKPLLEAQGLSLVISDEIINMGERFYVQANVVVSDGTDVIRATALAREPENKKGMDEAQITGSTSSYARKYALNGMFCIDDNKDPDSTNKHGRETPKVADRFSVKEGCVGVTDIIRLGETPKVANLQKHGDVGTCLDYNFKSNLIDNYVPRREDFVLPTLSGEWQELYEGCVANVSDVVADNSKFFDKVTSYEVDTYVMDKTYLYRGEADVICNTKDGFYVLDIKKTKNLTKNKTMRNNYLMQCVAYAYGIGKENCLGVVILSPDAFIVECNLEPIWEQFLMRRGEFKGKFGI